MPWHTSKEYQAQSATVAVAATTRIPVTISSSMRAQEKGPPRARRPSTSTVPWSRRGSPARDLAADQIDDLRGAGDEFVRVGLVDRPAAQQLHTVDERPQLPYGPGLVPALDLGQRSFEQGDEAAFDPLRKLEAHHARDEVEPDQAVRRRLEQRVHRAALREPERGDIRSSPLA